jgi:hypothetical protein
MNPNLPPLQGSRFVGVFRLLVCVVSCASLMPYRNSFFGGGLEMRVPQGRTWRGLVLRRFVDWWAGVCFLCAGADHGNSVCPAICESPWYSFTRCTVCKRPDAVLRRPAAAHAAVLRRPAAAPSAVLRRPAAAPAVGKRFCRAEPLLVAGSAPPSPLPPPPTRRCKSNTPH